MKRKRYSVEQIVAAVKQHDLGVSAADIARKLGIAEQTFYRRRKQPRGGLGRSGMDRRFPPLGVKAVASYSCATEKGGVAHQVAHQVAHAFDNPNAPLSEGGALAVVVQAVPGNPHWKRVGTDSSNPLR